MPYDLYGNSYPTRQAAELAEMAQCNEIDNRINAQQLRIQSEKQQRAEHDLLQRIDHLEQRIKDLEDKLS